MVHLTGSKQSAQWVWGQEECLRFGEGKEQTDKGVYPFLILIPSGPFGRKRFFHLLIQF